MLESSADNAGKRRHRLGNNDLEFEARGVGQNGVVQTMAGRASFIHGVQISRGAHFADGTQYHRVRDGDDLERKWSIAGNETVHIARSLDLQRTRPTSPNLAAR